jgi:hypothetical protein
MGKAEKVRRNKAIKRIQRINIERPFEDDRIYNHEKLGAVSGKFLNGLKAQIDRENING